MNSNILLLIFRIVEMILGPLKDFLLGLDEEERHALLQKDPRESRDA